MIIQRARACAKQVSSGWGGVTAFALVAPALGIVVARLVQPIAGPAMASAESAGSPHATDTTQAQERTHYFRALNADEQARLAGMGSAQITAPKGTPLMKLAGEPSAAAAPVEILEEVPTITPPPLGVSSIMATKTEPIAVVGGKLLRSGDEVSPGWKIGKIDPNAGTVTLVHESGFEHTLNLRQ